MTHEQWRTSSYTGPNGNCVELVGTLDRLRDSKNPGPQLHIDLTQLLTDVKAGHFDR